MDDFMKFTTALLFSIAIVATAAAQESPAAPGGAAAESATYDSLSPRNKKICETLFNSQTVTADSAEPLSLDQIAAASARKSWAQIFGRMKKGGLVDAKTLADLLHGQDAKRIERSRPRAGTGGVVIVTTGDGHQQYFERHGLEVGDTGLHH